MSLCVPNSGPQFRNLLEHFADILCLSQQPCESFQVRKLSPGLHTYSKPHRLEANFCFALDGFLASSAERDVHLCAYTEHLQTGWISCISRTYSGAVKHLGYVCPQKSAALTGLSSLNFLKTAKVLRIPGFHLPQIHLVKFIPCISSTLHSCCTSQHAGTQCCHSLQGPPGHLARRKDALCHCPVSSIAPHPLSHSAQQSRDAAVVPKAVLSSWQETLKKCTTSIC